MKKIRYLLLSLMVLSIGLVGCTTSESAVQTAMAQTEEVDQSATQDGLNVQKTQESNLAATETAKTLAVAQTQTAKTLAVAQTQAALPINCTPGGTYVDVAGDISIDYVDILKVDTFLETDVLTVTFYVRELPKEITINREGMQRGVQEYTWAVDIDVDDDPATGGFGPGGGGVEYIMLLFSFDNGKPLTGPIEKLIPAHLWKIQGKSTRDVNTPKLTIDYEKSTITLSSKIPGINKNSILYFSTYLNMLNGTLITDNLCVTN